MIDKESKQYLLQLLFDIKRDRPDLVKAMSTQYKNGTLYKITLTLTTK